MQKYSAFGGLCTESQPGVCRYTPLRICPMTHSQPTTAGSAPDDTHSRLLSSHGSCTCDRDSGNQIKSIHSKARNVLRGLSKEMGLQPISERSTANGGGAQVCWK